MLRPRLAAALLALLSACGGGEPGGTVIRFPSSGVGAEAEVLELQLARFAELYPEIRVVRRRTPDAADQRRQLYVQWLNAQADRPDVLQLDVIWTPEFAAAGWILPLDAYGLDTGDFFPATLAANRWRGRLYAVPWFVDVGMLYWRSDLLESAPGSFEALDRAAARAQQGGEVRWGLVWPAARYEGLVTVFLEYLTGFGGAILDARGRVVVDSPAAVRALSAMRDALQDGLVPRRALTWHEEETRFAFQNGRALLMRNWPYAAALLAAAPDSRVAGRFGVAPMPAAPGGRHGAALGGSQLAINAHSRHPDAAWLLIEYLTRPAQMRERALRAGQLPARRALYAHPELEDALPLPAAELRAVVERAVPRPVTPVYSELSELLQVRLHRALTGQQGPGPALADAAREIRALLERVELAPPETPRAS